MSEDNVESAPKPTGVVLTDDERYVLAAHAMQTGVAGMLATGSNQASPKHLRTGINSAMVNDHALVNLLIAKGIFTLEEYKKELADCMEKERDDYAKRLSDFHGRPVTLH